MLQFARYNHLKSENLKPTRLINSCYSHYAPARNFQISALSAKNTAISSISMFEPTNRLTVLKNPSNLLGVPRNFKKSFHVRSYANQQATSGVPTTEVKPDQQLPSTEQKPEPQIILGAGLESVINHAAILVGRSIEWGTLILGYEQAQKYTLMNENDQIIGYMAEDDSKLSSIFSRQLLKTHRPFKAAVFDTSGNVVLEIERPAYLLSSSLYVKEPSPDPQAEPTPIGEVQMEWQLTRRKYNLFLGKDQFAQIDEQMLMWDFHLRDSEGKVLSTINRNWSGFGKELFTDAGKYVIRMDPTMIQQLEEGAATGRELNLKERAMTLAVAVSIDYDYFSRSSGGFGFLPLWGMPPAPIPPAGVDPSPTGAPIDTPSAPTTPNGEEIMQDKEPTWDVTGRSSSQPNNHSPQEEEAGEKDDDDDAPWTFEGGESEGGEGGGFLGKLGELGKIFTDD